MGNREKGFTGRRWVFYGLEWNWLNGQRNFVHRASAVKSTNPRISFPAIILTAVKPAFQKIFIETHR